MLNLFQIFSKFFCRVIRRIWSYSSIFVRAHGVLCLGFIAMILPGCAIKRNGYDVPQLALPAQYKNSTPAGVPDTTSSSKDSNVLPAKPNVPQDAGLAEWWRTFGNSELVELVDRGLANNPDVRIATLRMAQANARADQARAGLMPTISAPFGAAIQMPGGTIGSVPVGTEDRTTQKSYQASVRGSWRADIWGEQSSLAESAKFHLWQAAFDRDNVQRNMAANLASSYVEFLSLNDRLRVARETETVLSGMLAAIETRVDAGDATLIDLDQQKAAIFAARATMPNLEQQREDALSTIASLVGTVPGSLKLSSDGLDALYLPAVVPALPSSLLLRRPDVRMAEARLLAADADVDVARARILPPLDLSAQVGYSSLSMARFFQPQALFWNALANLTANIFDGGKLASEKENAQAIHEEMVETYARAIYQAVREVESALVTIRLNGKRLDAQQEVIASARRAWDSSAEVYAVGGLDYLALLDTERTYQRYLDEYQRIKMDHYRGYISLFQALGGGVKFAEQLPGKGVRPTLARGDALGSVSLAAPKKVSATAGVDWVVQSSAENFWQVELPGLYHRSTIGATWRDLRTRYPKLMGSRVVRPRLNGRIEDSADDQMSWYRLYVGKFATPETAHELCAALKANFQRCRVVSSRSDETVAVPPLPQKDKAPAAESSPGVVRGSGTLSANKLSPASASSETAGRAAGESDMESDPALSPSSVPAPESTATTVKNVPAGSAGIAGKQNKGKG